MGQSFIWQWAPPNLEMGREWFHEHICNLECATKKLPDGPKLYQEGLALQA